jgi:hypothetical protein
MEILISKEQKIEIAKLLVDIIFDEILRNNAKERYSNWDK